MKPIGWFEEYACGCVSEIVKYKKDLIGYCPDHGDDRRNIYPDFGERYSLSADADKSLTAKPGGEI